MTAGRQEKCQNAKDSLKAESLKNIIFQQSLFTFKMMHWLMECQFEMSQTKCRITKALENASDCYNIQAVNTSQLLQQPYDKDTTRTQKNEELSNHFFAQPSSETPRGALRNVLFSTNLMISWLFLLRRQSSLKWLFWPGLSLKPSRTCCANFALVNFLDNLKTMTQFLSC